MILLIGISAFIIFDLLLWSQSSLKHTRWRELSSFNYDSLKRSTVSIVASDDPSLSRPAPITDKIDYVQVEAMVARSIQLIGGFDKLIKPGTRKIIIKPNIVEPDSSGKGTITDCRVVKALAVLLYRFDPTLDIAVGEAAGGWAKRDTPNAPGWSLSADGYVVSGYSDMIEALKKDTAYPGLNVRWVDMNYDDTVRVPVPAPRLSDTQTSLFLPRTLVEADFIIDVPVLKVHTTRITVGLKNYVGVLPGMVYGWSHDQGYNKNGLGLDHSPNILQKNIVELVRTAGCDLVVVDAIVGKEQSKYTSGISKRRNMILAGTDIVSVDAVSAKLMDINPDDVEHVSLAALAGLGQNDLDRIDIVGSTIEKSKTKFIKSESNLPTAYVNENYPHYGQGNRVWLLHGPHFGIDMNTDYLKGEAGAVPLPEKDGWSRPLYFFDDAIDPAGFYQDSTDCIYYAFTYLKSNQASPARLWIGSGGNLKVWLNDSLVYNYKSGTRQHKLPNDLAGVNIKAGINRILVKALQRYGVCEFSLNVCETESDSNYAGNRLAGIKFVSQPDLNGLCSVAGTLLYDGKPVSEIEVSLTNLLLSKIYRTSSSGAFLFDNLPQGTYTISPSAAIYTFNPLSSNVVLSDTITVALNFNAADCKADMNKDKALNILDAVVLLRNVSQNPSEASDFNGDGKKDVLDVLGLILFLIANQ
jgi:uncharacterized protein (DUF362 family)